MCGTYISFDTAFSMTHKHDRVSCRLSIALRNTAGRGNVKRSGVNEILYAAWPRWPVESPVSRISCAVPAKITIHFLITIES